MKPNMVLREVGDRSLLPLGIVALASTLVPIVCFLVPSGRHLFIAMTAASFSWVWVLPLISNAAFACVWFLLERKR